MTKSNSKRVKNWREKHKKICTVCHLTKIKHNSTMCVSCRAQARSLGDLKLEEVIYNNLHKSSAFSLVRSRARALYKDKILNGCQICGYKVHVEVCHIKPISEFSLETRLSEINQESNILILCPNHHWEFDNNIICISNRVKG